MLWNKVELFFFHPILKGWFGRGFYTNTTDRFTLVISSKWSQIEIFLVSLNEPYTKIALSKAIA